ncbi:DUF2637 domain-containing protein [Rhizohabitans arisaemae]|uniref:DUF2637 domain-containing protein n=1 Tax=Rhizohabitans arisaemae TaxID=2720610 RepID=UPI0024B07F59|nr:DUF2637 domain-containing protein [Rhizohabitans arisaemae]
MDANPPSSTIQRLALALVGLGVSALAVAACIVSFDSLRALALAGEARPDLAFLYPAAFDALLGVALITVVVVRTGSLPIRIQAWFVLILMFATAVSASVYSSLGGVASAPPGPVVVAVLPWVLLAVGLWLWLLMFRHVRPVRSASTGIEDIVPFDPEPVPIPVTAPDLPAVPVPTLEVDKSPLPSPIWDRPPSKPEDPPNVYFAHVWPDVKVAPYPEEPSEPHEEKDPIVWAGEPLPALHEAAEPTSQNPDLIPYPDESAREPAVEQADEPPSPPGDEAATSPVNLLPAPTPEPVEPDVEEPVRRHTPDAPGKPPLERVRSSPVPPLD